MGCSDGFDWLAIYTAIQPVQWNLSREVAMDLIG